MADAFGALPPRDRAVAEHWATDEFRAALRDWCASYIGPVTAMRQHKLRGWATVWQVESEQGSYYAKQNCPLQNFEVPLMAALARLVPRQVVPVTAATDGFLLTPDQGPTLYASASGNLDAWQRVTAEGAALQRELAAHRELLEGAGVSTLEPEATEEYVALRVGQYAGLAEADLRRLDPEVARRVEAHLPVVRRWVEQVAALGLPVTLNHNDLHENNVFDRVDGLRFFDFGDAVLTEPLGVLYVPLSLVAEQLGAGPDDPRLWRLADAALEVWSDVVPLADLRAALPAALQLGRLSRVEAWVRCLPYLTDDELGQWGGAVAGWLGSLLEDPPVTATAARDTSPGGHRPP